MSSTHPFLLCDRLTSDNTPTDYRGFGARTGTGTGVEGGDGWVATNGGNCGHVQDSADGGAAARHHAPAAQRTAVAVERSNADEGRDLASGEPPEFGQVGRTLSPREGQAALHKTSELSV